MTTTPDTTVTGKAHFEVLDGLRGSAAVLVVLFHIMGMTVSWADTGQLLHHAALAVDFFFVLSGFVIAFAYDDRWQTMTTRQFILIRLVRLHPLVLLGAVLGLLSFIFDPFATNQKAIPLGTVFSYFALICLLLPHPPLPNRWTDTHSLNSPAWSLLQEYIGNLAYALVLRRLGTKTLGLLVVLAGVLLAWCAWDKNTLDLGSYWETLWQGTARMAFSFMMGLWLYRVRDRFPKIRLGWIAATIVLVAVFATPLMPKDLPVFGPHTNGLYEVSMVIVVFPLLILCGAHSQIPALEMALCKFAGRISYPIYILHYPFLLIYMNFVTFTKPPLQTAHIAGAVSFVIVVTFAWLAVKFFDEPVRNWLKPLTRRVKG